MKCKENKLDANIVAEKNITVFFIRKHTRFDNQLKEVVIPSRFTFLERLQVVQVLVCR